MGYTSPWANAAPAAPTTYKSPFGTAPPAKAPSLLNRFESNDEIQGIQKIFTPFQAVDAAAGHPTGKVLDLLSRSGQAGAALFAGEDAPQIAHSFFSGDTDQYARDTDSVKQHLGIKGAVDKLPSWGRGVADALVQTAVDPMTVIGGSGALDKAVSAVGSRGFVAGAKGLDALAKKGGRLGQAADAVGGLHDAFNFKGAVKRALAVRNGREGLDQFGALKAINNAKVSKEGGLGNTLVTDFRKTHKDLSPEDMSAIQKAVNTGTVDALSPELQARAAEFKQTTDALAHLQGTRGLKAELKGGGFELPQQYGRFDDSVRSLQATSQYRPNYVPHGHDFQSELDLHAPAKSISELDKRMSGEIKTLRDLAESRNVTGPMTTRGLKAEDRNLLERSDSAQLLDPEFQNKIIEQRLRGGARAIAEKDAEREISRLFGVSRFGAIPPEAKAFFKETYNTPGAKEFWGGIARRAIDLPKQGLFSLPFRHMANIGTLSLFADPSIENITGTAGRFARLLTAKSPEARSAILGKAERFGVTGVPSIDNKIGWIGKVPLVGDIYRLSSHVLWTFDDAAKATRFQRIMDAGLKEGLKHDTAAYRAANQVGAELIDYSNRSPFTKALGYIAPFATFRTKIPGAVARTAVRYPERLAIANRVAPGVVGEDQQTPNGMTAHVANPITDSFQMVQDPARYARATAGLPANMLLSKIGELGAQPGRENNYMTDNKKPDLKFVLNQLAGSFPFGLPQLLDALGQNEFPAKSYLEDLLRGQSGVSVR